MVRKVLVVLGLLLVAGCGRDFSMPGAKALALSPQTASVAPLEQVTFGAKNGTEPYTFAIATNGSGGATIDAKTGAYRAGPVGPATDVVRVTDASGLVVVANVSVGPKLTVSPTLTLAAPGGKVALTAAGGKPPYTATATTNASGGSFGGTDGLTWTVGTTGAGTDVLEVTDAVGATVESQVHVGQGLALLPTRDPTVAPLETLAFVATGGQPPYTFSVTAAGSGAPGRTQGDPPLVGQTGMYQAGPVGSTTDTVEVTDGNGQTATADVTVTAPLAARFDNPNLHPDAPVHVIATGGKPPYAYRFAAHGNHSGGTVDRTTGLYTPGWAFGVADSVEVVDAVGAVASVPASNVGALMLTGDMADTAAFADLDGNGLSDLLVPDFDSNAIHAYLMQPSELPVVHTYPYPSTSVAVAAVPGLDLEGHGHEDVLIQDTTGELDLWLPDPDGGLTRKIPIVGSGYYQPFYGLRLDNGDASIFVTTASCNGVSRIDVPAASQVPTGAVCARAPTGLGSAATWLPAFVNADDIPDVVWVDGNQITVAYGPTYGTKQTRSLGPIGSQLSHAVAVRIGGTGGSADQQAVFALMADPSGNVVVTGLVDGAPMTNMTVPALNNLTQSGIAAVPQPSTGTGSVVVWDTLSRALVSIGRDGDGTFWTRTSKNALPTGSFDWAVAGDANGDGIADLAMYGLRSASVAVLWGDGYGGYDSRPRVGGISFPRTGDLDGDGLDDVAAQSGSALSVLRGFAGGLVWDPPAEVPLTDGPLAIGEVGTDGQVDLLYAQEGDGLWALDAGPSGPWTNAFRVDLPQAAKPAEIYSVRTAPFGGTAPGTDLLLTTVVGSQEHYEALVRNPGSVGVVPIPDPPAEYCFFATAYDATGDGVANDVLVSCWDSAGPGFAVWRSVGTEQNGAIASFGTPAAQGAVPHQPEIYLPVGSAEADIAGVYESGALSGSGHLLLAFGTGVVELTVPYVVRGAAVGDLDGDGRPDLVVGDASGAVHVILDATGSSPSGVVATYAGGDVRSLIRLDAGAPYDVLVQSGHDLVVLKGDGAGGLQ